MDKNLVRAFNVAYSMEPTAAQRQAAEDLLAVWVKLDSSAAKNPAIHRRALLLGMCLQEAITNGTVIPRPVKEKRQGKPTAEGVKNG